MKYSQSLFYYGIYVRFITGKGRFSANARTKRYMYALSQQYNIVRMFTFIYEKVERMGKINLRIRLLGVSASSLL